MITFVGAGPGDLELLTCKGQRRLSSAEVVIYDRLVNPLLLFHCPPNCKFIYVGKQPYQDSIGQAAINQFLLNAHQNADKVVRLKGGDPEIFGRLAEEIAVVQQAVIPFEIIPGITAASGAAAYSGFPLTRRGQAGSVCFMTGYTKQGSFEQLTSLSLQQTICLYMGMESFRQTLPQLLDVFPETTPIALVQWGTYGRQKKVSGTLATIAARLAEHKLQNPAIIIIGAVVAQHTTFDWYERLPLKGQRLLLIASRPPQISELIHYTEQGADLWWHQVGPKRDRRFDEISERYLAEHAFEQIKFIDEAAKAAYQAK